MSFRGDAENAKHHRARGARSGRRRIAAILATTALVGAGAASFPLIDAVTAPPAAAVIDFDCGSSQGLGYFVNTGAGSVSIVYTGTDQVIATVPVGGEPYGVGATPDGKKVYVAGADGGVAVIDTNTLAVTPVTADADFSWANPVGAWSSEDGTKMFVSDYSADFIAVIDTATDTVVDTISIPVSEGPGWMDGVGDLLFVANTFSGGFTIIDMSTDAIVQNVVTPEGAHTIAVNDDYIVTANADLFNSLFYVRTRANPAGPAQEISIPSDASIHGIAFVPATNYLIVPTMSNTDANAHTYVYDISTGALLRTFDAGQQKLNMPIVSPITPDVFIAGGDSAGTAGSMDHLRVEGDPSTWTYVPNQAALEANPDNHTPAFSCLRALEGTKSLADPAIRVGQTTRLDISIQNFNTAPGTGVTGVSLLDTLPSALQIANPANASTTCAGGVVSAASGTRDVSLSGGTIPAATFDGGVEVPGACTVEVDVVAVGPPGAYTNLIPAGGITGDPVGPSTEPVENDFTVLPAEPTVTAQVDVPTGRALPADQFTTAITAGPTTVATATTAGAESGLQNQDPSEIASATAAAGTTYTFTQTPAGATDPNAYLTAFSCVDTRHGNTVLASGSGPVASLAVPADGDVAVVCTFTNTLVSPALTVALTAAPATLGAAGSTMTFTPTVTNTGNVPLTDVSVELTSFSGTGAAPVVDCPPGPLAPGAAVQCTSRYLVTQADVDAGRIVSAVVASGQPPSGPRTTSAPSPALVIAPAATASSPLAMTGSSAVIPWLLGGAAVALLAGILLVVVARRHRPNAGDRR